MLKGVFFRDSCGSLDGMFWVFQDGTNLLTRVFCFRISGDSLDRMFEDGTEKERGST